MPIANWTFCSFQTIAHDYASMDFKWRFKRTKRSPKHINAKAMNDAVRLGNALAKCTTICQKIGSTFIR